MPTNRNAPQPVTYYEDLERRLRSLSPLVGDVVPADLVRWWAEYLDVGEYGLAVEVVGEQIPTEDVKDPRVHSLAAGLLAEAEIMGLGEQLLARLRLAG